MIYSLYILNRAGGLIFQKDFVTNPNMKGNDYFVISGVFHGLHAIASDLSIVKKSSYENGLQSLECGTFRLECFRRWPVRTTEISSSSTPILLTASLFVYDGPVIVGVKFFLTAAPNTPGGGDQLQDVLRQIYVLYTDYVMKDPFYEMDMPIRVNKFSTRVADLVKHGRRAP